MEASNFLIGLDAFRSGEPRPLLMPRSVSTELTINARFEDKRREWEAAHGRNVGYQFPWGQIHEEAAEPCADSSPDQLAIEWHFILSELHTEFLWAGGNLLELSDCCVDILEHVEACAREQSAGEFLPPHVSFSEGNAMSAFSVLVWGSANLAAAREWVADMFVPALLPIVIERACRLNEEARDAAAGKPQEDA
jgi:hypothetical protein